ncbi:unnamed protein product [Hymenolepis diminuta]|uniref:V-type proton ATPase subunit n=1 Tax=Hymenolepis diminuta TaxID=6216 RepID=A0A0R3SC41_HYMDI|nr:unnamed protein product [Hymenolepis diminuta]
MSLGFFIPFAVMTSFWGLVGIIGPFCVPKSPNKEYVRCSYFVNFRLWRVSIVLTAICCYLSWLIFFLAQWHPFYGPTLSSKTLRVMQLEWKPKW